MPRPPARIFPAARVTRKGGLTGLGWPMLSAGGGELGARAGLSGGLGVCGGECACMLSVYVCVVQDPFGWEAVSLALT